MPSYYRLLKYSPDSAHDECIVLAVVAYDERFVTTRTTEDWDRVGAFARADSAHLREIAREWAEAFESWSVPQVAAHRSHYMSCVYLDEPRASLLNPHALADRLVGRLLKGEHPEQAVVRAADPS